MAAIVHFKMVVMLTKSQYSNLQFSTATFKHERHIHHQALASKMDELGRTNLQPNLEMKWLEFQILSFSFRNRWKTWPRTSASVTELSAMRTPRLSVFCGRPANESPLNESPLKRRHTREPSPMHHVNCLAQAHRQGGCHKSIRQRLCRVLRGKSHLRQYDEQLASLCL